MTLLEDTQPIEMEDEQDTVLIRRVRSRNWSVLAVSIAGLALIGVTAAWSATNPGAVHFSPQSTTSNFSPSVSPATTGSVTLSPDGATVGAAQPSQSSSESHAAPSHSQASTKRAPVLVKSSSPAHSSSPSQPPSRSVAAFPPPPSPSPSDSPSDSTSSSASPSDSAS